MGPCLPVFISLEILRSKIFNLESLEKAVPYITLILPYQGEKSQSDMPILFICTYHQGSQLSFDLLQKKYA